MIPIRDPIATLSRRRRDQAICVRERPAISGGGVDGSRRGGIEDGHARIMPLSDAFRARVCPEPTPCRDSGRTAERYVMSVRTPTPNGPRVHIVIRLPPTRSRSRRSSGQTPVAARFLRPFRR